jgi:hypothetical protein
MTADMVPHQLKLPSVGDVVVAARFDSGVWAAQDIYGVNQPMLDYRLGEGSLRSRFARLFRPVKLHLTAARDERSMNWTMRHRAPADLLFVEADSFTVQDHQRKGVEAEIGNMDGNRLLNTNVDDLLAYVVEKYRIDVPELDDAT